MFQRLTCGSEDVGDTDDSSMERLREAEGDKGREAEEDKRPEAEGDTESCEFEKDKCREIDGSFRFMELFIYNTLIEIICYRGIPFVWNDESIWS